jgi:Cu-Zn family superoxide dismutase
VHQFGDCSAPDATSAGGHFNPSDHPHGAPDADERHAGDMGNIEANDQGVATLDYVDKVMKLDGPGSIIGHAVIVHEKADDLKSQPTGDAGGRIACGVVGVANPEPAKQ